MSGAADALRIAAEFAGLGAKVTAKSVTITRHYVALGVTKTRGRASGRPGPRAITGRYRRSISGRTQMSGGDVEGSFGTGEPQGPRLELGFVGTDSLGRRYNQPPFPHFTPTFAEIEKPYADAIADQVDL